MSTYATQLAGGWRSRCRSCGVSSPTMSSAQAVESWCRTHVCDPQRTSALTLAMARVIHAGLIPDPLDVVLARQAEVRAA